MKILTNKQEAAKEVNFGKHPVIVMEKFEYGSIGYIKVPVTSPALKSRGYSETRTTIVRFNGNNHYMLQDDIIILTSEENLTTRDVRDMIHYANAPIIDFKGEKELEVIIFDKGLGGENPLPILIKLKGRNNSFISEEIK